MRATGAGFTKLAKPVLVFEWQGISAKAPMVGDYRGGGSRPGGTAQRSVGNLPNTRPGGNPVIGT